MGGPQRRETDFVLDRWVEDSGYNQGAMIVAATTKALTIFGAGFVDIPSLGDGVRAGTLSCILHGKIKCNPYHFGSPHDLTRAQSL